jgi:hypothetical protein
VPAWLALAGRLDGGAAALTAITAKYHLKQDFWGLIAQLIWRTPAFAVWSAILKVIRETQNRSPRTHPAHSLPHLNSSSGCLPTFPHTATFTAVIEEFGPVRQNPFLCSFQLRGARRPLLDDLRARDRPSAPSCAIQEMASDLIAGYTDTPIHDIAVRVVQQSKR